LDGKGLGVTGSRSSKGGIGGLALSGTFLFSFLSPLVLSKTPSLTVSAHQAASPSSPRAKASSPTTSSPTKSS
jgi:hypothetical protein